MKIFNIATLIFALFSIKADTDFTLRVEKSSFLHIFKTLNFNISIDPKNYLPYKHGMKKSFWYIFHSYYERIASGEVTVNVAISFNGESSTFPLQSVKKITDENNGSEKLLIEGKAMDKPKCYRTNNFVGFKLQKISVDQSGNIQLSFNSECAIKANHSVDDSLSQVESLRRLLLL